MPPLNQEQEKCVQLAQEGYSFLLTSAAGCGKTFCLERIVNTLQVNGKRVEVCAPTGIAALTLGGRTIHNLFKIPISLDTKVYAARNKNDLWHQIDCLVIDEISMVSVELLDFMDQAARNARRSSLPFGGMQIIMAGDFYQLPAVQKDVAEADLKFAFESAVWKKMKPRVVQLTQVMRQRNPQFANLLNSLRCGDITETTRDSLMKLTVQLKDRNINAPIQPIRLEALNRNKDVINLDRYSQLLGDEVRFHSTSTGDLQLLSGCLAVDLLCLKRGAPVIHICNNEEKNIWNGSSGRVTDLCPARGVQVIFLDNREMWIQPHCWQITTVEHYGRKAREVVVASKTQIPLVLAYAISQHKSQSLSIDILEVNLSQCFTPGMAYVAISRATDARTLVLRGIERKSTAELKRLFRVHPKVKEFYNNIT